MIDINLIEIIDFQPLICIAPLVGAALVGGAASLVSGIGNWLFGGQQQAQNIKMMREQMAHQTSERYGSQAFQDQQRKAQQAYQTSERMAQNQYQEDIYNQYQSPEAMVRQYNAAGLNGKLAVEGAGSLGSMSVSSGSNGGAPSSGAPSGGSVSAPYQPLNAMSSGFQSMMSGITSSLKDIAEARKFGADTTEVESLLQQKIRNLELDGDIKEFALFLDKRNLPRKQQLELANILVGVNQGLAMREQIKQFTKNLKIQGKITEKEEKEWYQKFFGDQQEQLSRIGNNYSNMELNAETIKNYPSLRHMQNSIASANNSVAKLNSLDFDIKSATTNEQKQLIHQHVENLKEQYAVLTAEAAKLQKEGKYYEWQMVNEMLGIIGQTVASIMIGRAALGRVPQRSDIGPVGFQY